MGVEQSGLIIDPASTDEAAPGETGALVQPCAFALELSTDWLILSASENAYNFVRAYHARLVGQPLANFTLAQPLHDLRNSLARQRSSSGIARAYRVKLIDGPRKFDIAFQVLEGRYLLEGLATSQSAFGVAYGSVSRLLDGLSESGRLSLAEGAARRMRALTGFDHVEIRLSGAGIDETATSSRGTPPTFDFETSALEHSLIIPDTSARPVPMFPRDASSDVAERALFRSPPSSGLAKLQEQGVSSVLTVPIKSDREVLGAFICTHGSAIEPNLEVHAAAELFAQVLAMRLQLRRS